MADANNEQAPVAAQPAQQSPETFSREYVRELREESKAYRLKAQEIEAAKQAAEAAAEKARQEATESISKAQAAANERVIRAELKAAAIKAGMIDLDGLKLADLSKVSLSDDGEVKGAEELMASLKEGKPYLFKQPAVSSAQPGEAPKPETPTPKKATEMTDEEYKREKAKLRGR